MVRRTLRELQGEIITLAGQPEGQREALFFVCPICPDGHGIIVQWQGQSIYPSGVIWQRTGSTLDDLTFSPSINCDVVYPDGHLSECKFHGWVRNGGVEWPG
jgi:hypothetical protein